MKLHYAGHQPTASGFGWATANNALVRELSKHAPISGYRDADAFFVPIVDHDLNPVMQFPPQPWRPVMGYCFFESELGPHALTNSRHYDVIFAGSTWCMKRLAERGIHNTKLLIQGVDESIFHPVPPRQPDGQYRIFSGGKFEYRKGQDLVIAAFRVFAKHIESSRGRNEPQPHLVCSWFNPWPGLMNSMRQSPYVPMLVMSPEADGYAQFDITQKFLRMSGLSDEQFTVCPQLIQFELSKAMAATDCGLFPNRCEGGTNLVLMEYAATGREVIANTLTGHADVRDAITTTIHSTEDEQHWAKSDVESIVDALCAAYQCRQTSPPNPPSWPWSAPAAIVLQTARELLGQRA